jgi:hypothetical protein
VFIQQFQIQRYTSVSASLLEIILNRCMLFLGIYKSEVKTPIQTILGGNTDYVKLFVLLVTV